MKKSFPLLLLLTLVSCAPEEKTKDKPDHILDTKKIIDVLVDLNISEATIGSHFLPGDTVRKGVATYYNGLFSRHGVTQDEFYKNIVYYASETNELLQITEKVLDSLNVLNTSLNNNNQ